MYTPARFLLALLLCLSCAARAGAAHPPATLSMWSANNLGRADLLPGDTVNVVIELRSETMQLSGIQHLSPDGLTLEHAHASAGALATTPFVSWSGVVSATQPINIVLAYRVQDTAQPRDLLLKAQAQADGHYLRASRLLRICCVPAPPATSHGYRIYVPLIRH